MISEAELIQTYLLPLSNNDEAALSFKDDAAFLATTEAEGLIISKDLLIQGVHFLKEDPPDHIAAKALAVNLSDLAGKAAKPRGFFMGLALPEAPDHGWMAAFRDGLKSLIDCHNCPLLGGDISRSNGGVVISITILGTPPATGMIKRRGAKAGDRLVVSGTLGDAALGFRLRQNPELADVWQLNRDDTEYLKSRYALPAPRLSLAPLVAKHAVAAMDLSDGLIEDLSKFAAANTLGAQIHIPSLPFSKAAQKAIKAVPDLLNDSLSWGDDYEILIAIRPKEVASFITASDHIGIPCQEIGCLHEQAGKLQFLDANGEEIILKSRPYRHF